MPKSCALEHLLRSLCNQDASAWRCLPPASAAAQRAHLLRSMQTPPRMLAEDPSTAVTLPPEMALSRLTELHLTELRPTGQRLTAAAFEAVHWRAATGRTIALLRIGPVRRARLPWGRRATSTCRPSASTARRMNLSIRSRARLATFARVTSGRLRKLQAPATKRSFHIISVERGGPYEAYWHCFVHRLRDYARFIRFGRRRTPRDDEATICTWESSGARRLPHAPRHGCTP
jgi:hypothetical protein